MAADPPNRQRLEPVIPEDHSPTVLPDPDLAMGDWTKELVNPYDRELGDPTTPNPGKFPMANLPDTGEGDTKPEAAGENPPPTTPSQPDTDQRHSAFEPD